MLVAFARASFGTFLVVDIPKLGGRAAFIPNHASLRSRRLADQLPYPGKVFDLKIWPANEKIEIRTDRPRSYDSTRGGINQDHPHTPG